MATLLAFRRPRSKIMDTRSAETGSTTTNATVHTWLPPVRPKIWSGNAVSLLFALPFVPAPAEFREENAGLPRWLTKGVDGWYAFLFVAAHLHVGDLSKLDANEQETALPAHEETSPATKRAQMPRPKVFDDDAFGQSTRWNKHWQASLPPFVVSSFGSWAWSSFLCLFFTQYLGLECDERTAADCKRMIPPKR